jgi:Polyketide cyclase / dehydrase and lipid transport
MTAACRLTGRLTVPLPPDQAFRLFTPRGEQAWVPGWVPHFPASVTDDAPGTVFETHAHAERTIWVVVDRIPGRRISYARVAPHAAAGTVTVTLDDAGSHSEVTVTYILTALTDAANDYLHEFSEGYPEFLSTWQGAIAAALRT